MCAEGITTNFSLPLVCWYETEMVAVHSSAPATVQYGLAVTIFVLPSFSLLQGDRRVKSWTPAKRGRPAMQLKLLQAKQEETQGAIEEEKEEKKK